MIIKISTTHDQARLNQFRIRPHIQRAPAGYARSPSTNRIRQSVATKPPATTVPAELSTISTAGICHRFAGRVSATSLQWSILDIHSLAASLKPAPFTIEDRLSSRYGKANVQHVATGYWQYANRLCKIPNPKRPSDTRAAASPLVRHELNRPRAHGASVLFRMKIPVIVAAFINKRGGVAA
jgi:hypothetical protein